ncbi:MAG: bifunctional pyr operon transcriptional regulator/uracil phosphoribosyltransferase, partial [Candidatus Omnitrophica bacterium]|nr:bifunctional pyr operon transcriptional regulator/uracil phosphoribosyltransferase [Candidatus Omnitrophota bacterium]
MAVQIMDAQAIQRAITRISHEILERNKGIENLALVGIRTRGVFLAERLASCIKKIDEGSVPVGIMDITLYRDDIATTSPQSVVRTTEIPF